MKNKIFKNNLTLILWLASLVYTLPVYNKYWAPFDEGIIAVAAQRLLAGEVPYKDFFIIMYPPGQIYVLAAIFKMFAHPLIAGRIYAVLVSVGSTMLVFFMARILTKNLAVSLFAWFVALTSLAPRLGAIPTPIWPGVFLGLLSVYNLMIYLKDYRALHIFISGIVAGLAITFRHDIGLFALVAIIFALSVQALFYSRSAVRNIVFFIIGSLLVPAIWVSHFIKISASKDMFNSLVGFTFIHQKTAALPFPRPCLDLNMIFHSSLQFISINQFYIPIIVYAFVAVFILARIFKFSPHEERENLALLAVLLFGALTFNQARIRTDPAHLLTVIEPALILAAFMFHNTISFKSGSKFISVVKYALCALIAFLLILLSVKNIDKYIKNTYTKVYKRSIIKTEFDKGAIYIPKEERGDVLATLQFIRQKTAPGERIFIGNMAHWKDDFGGTLIMYYLSDRLPSTKFYEFLPGLITQREVQEEIADSLKERRVRLVVLQDVDTASLNKESVPSDRLILDNFIQRNYEPWARFGKYHIYKSIGNR